VRTLGVDLASQDRNTAICVVDWERRRVESLRVGVGDAAIVALLREGMPAGIDAPFGWPAAFVAALASWTDSDRWTEPWTPETQRLLRLRETDRWIASTIGKWPLSVSADSIAMCAMRAATLLHAAGVKERVNGPVYEVYPGAALRRWGLAAKGYKRDAAVRARLVDALGVDGADRDALARSDHALDALLSAMVARAAALGLTEPPPDDLDPAVIAREGWIHLPRVGSLSALRTD
jgi:predicted nuclease with RNAse H fold